MPEQAVLLKGPARVARCTEATTREEAPESSHGLRSRERHGECVAGREANARELLAELASEVTSGERTEHGLSVEAKVGDLHAELEDFMGREVEEHAELGAQNGAQQAAHAHPTISGVAHVAEAPSFAATNDAADDEREQNERRVGPGHARLLGRR